MGGCTSDDYELFRGLKRGTQESVGSEGNWTEATVLGLEWNEQEFWETECVLSTTLGTSSSKN